MSKYDESRGEPTGRDPRACPVCGDQGVIVDGPRQVWRLVVPALYRRHRCPVDGERWNSYQVSQDSFRALTRLTRAARKLAGRLHEVEGSG